MLIHEITPLPTAMIATIDPTLNFKLNFLRIDKSSHSFTELIDALILKLYEFKQPFVEARA